MGVFVGVIEAFLAILQAEYGIVKAGPVGTEIHYYTLYKEGSVHIITLVVILDKPDLIKVGPLFDYFLELDLADPSIYSQIAGLFNN